MVKTVNSYKLKISTIMGIQGSRNQYSFNDHYYVIQDSFPADNYYRLQSKLTDELFVGREIQSLDKQDVHELECIVSEKLRNPSPFVTKLLSAQKNTEKGYCETNSKFYLLYREVSKLLSHQIEQRKQRRTGFSADEITMVIIRVAKGIKYIYDIGHYHGNVLPSSISWPNFNHESIQLIDEWALRDQNRVMTTRYENGHQQQPDRKSGDRNTDLHSLGLVAKAMLDISPQLYNDNSPSVQALKHKIFVLMSQNALDRTQIYNIFTHQDRQIQNRKLMVSNHAVQQPASSHQFIHGQQTPSVNANHVVSSSMNITNHNANYHNYNQQQVRPPPVVPAPYVPNVISISKPNPPLLPSQGATNTNMIRKSRISEVRSQMASTQPQVKFGSATTSLNYQSTSQLGKIPTNNNSTIYSQSVPFTKTNVNFGSSNFNTSSNVPSSTAFLNPSFSSTNLSFPHLKGISQDRNQLPFLKQKFLNVAANKPNYSVSTPIPQNLTPTLKQQFVTVASNFSKSPQIEPYRPITTIPEMSPFLVNNTDKTSTTATTISQFTLLNHNNNGSNLQSDGVISHVNVSNHASPTFGSPTFTSSGHQSSSLFSFQDSLSSNDKKSSDGGLFTSSQFFSKVHGTEMKFNNIKIEDHQNSFEPPKVQNSITNMQVTSHEPLYTVSRAQKTPLLPISPNQDKKPILQQKEKQQSPEHANLPSVNTSSEFNKYSQHNFNEIQRVSVIPELNEQSDGDELDRDREYVVEEYENGSRYEGEKVNNMRDGQGKFYYKEGSYYDGHWKSNNMHGFGRLYYPNHKLAYEGDWFIDQFHGHGKVYNDEATLLEGPFDYTNFDNIEEKWKHYEGTLVCDSKEGFGKLVLSNGEYYEGNFQGDRVHGEGKFVNMYGQTIHGVWSDSKLIKINDF